MIKHPLIDHLPITGDMVSLWLPSGQNRAIDVIRGNHGQCFGTHPNVPVIQDFGPNALTDGGLNVWASATDLTNWTEYKEGTSTINREATEKIEGDYSCRLDVDASNSQVQFYQMNIPLTPLKRQKVIIWYKNSVAGKNSQFYIRDLGNNVYLKEDGTWNVGAYWIVLPNSLIWTPYEVEFYAHPDYSSYLMLLREKLAASSSIYFDKVSIEEIGPSLINPFVGWCFDNTNDRIDIPEIVFTGEYTLFGYVFRSDVLGLDPLFAHTTEMGKVGFKLDANKLHVVAFNGGGNDETVTVNLDRWDFIAVTRDSNNKVDAYVNDGGANRIFADAAQAGTLKINRIGYDGTNYFNEYAAILGCANKAWSQARVNNFYLQTKSLFAPRG